MKCIARIALLLCGVFGIFIIIFACGSDCLDSVHFHSGYPDFGTPPRRAQLINLGERDDRPVHKEYFINAGDRPSELHENYVDPWSHQPDRLQQLLKRARTAERTGDWREALRLYQSVKAQFGNRGEICDRLDLLPRIVAKRPQSAELKALTLFCNALDMWNVRARPALYHIYQSPQAGVVREHALYQYACLQTPSDKTIQYLRKLLRVFPNTPKREAALIMMARAALHMPINLQSPPPTREEMAIAENAISRLLKGFPKSRFRGAAIGLRARINLLSGRPHDAILGYFSIDDLNSVEEVLRGLNATVRERYVPRLIAAYLSRMARTTEFSTYEWSVLMAYRHFHELTDQETSAFKLMLFRNPELVANYFYFRLYHSHPTKSEIRGLAGLGQQLAAAGVATKMHPKVAAQLAETYYQDHKYEEAIRWADQALSAKPIDRAYFPKGASLHKLGRFPEAIAAFKTLLAKIPKGSCRRGAREELALLYEQSGNPGAAVDQYFALGYKLDVAFLLDARMTMHQVEGYLRQTTDPYKRTIVQYTLGIRYLRDENWSLAERYLRSVPKKEYAKFSAGRKRWESKPSPEPLSAVRDLRRLHHAIGRARGSNAKAAAMYAYASYYYKHGLLLLYNPRLWQDDRMIGIDFWWNPSAAQKSDVAALRNHMYSHDVYSRCRQICLDIIRKYPKSPTAPAALYRAACSSRYIWYFNNWWREEARRNGSASEPGNLLRKLVKDYPTDPLARQAGKYAIVFDDEMAGIWHDDPTGWPVQ